MFSSKFKINLILGPRMKNQHDKTSSFMIVSKVPKLQFVTGTVKDPDE